MDPTDVEVKIVLCDFPGSGGNERQGEVGRVGAAGAYCPVHSTYHLSM